MKYSILIAAFVLFCLPVSLRAETDLPGLEGIPEVVAEVDHKPIKRMELIRELVGSAGSKALERLIHRILIEQAAAELNIRVTDQDIELQYQADARELARDLIHVEHNIKDSTPMADIIRTKFGMDVAEYKNVIVRQRLLAQRCMASDLNPSEAELHKFFQTYPDMFQEPVRYHAAHILISPLDPRDMMQFAGRLKGQFAQMLDSERLRQLRIDRYRDENIDVADNAVEQINDSWRQAKIKAEQLTKQLQAYPNRWNDYVRKYSQDPMDQPPPRRRNKQGLLMPQEPPQRERAMLKPGEVGWFHKRGPMVPKFYEGAKNIKPGEIGGPIETEFGFHIVKMLEVKFPPIVTFAQCRERVRALYIDNEIQLRSDSWLTQLAARADLKTEKATLWPPKSENEREGNALPDIEAPQQEQLERDPVVGKVNGTPLKRSDVWKELLRTDGEEAVKRLVNREVVLNILKAKGVAYMEWLCASPEHRPLDAPPVQPMQVSENQIQLELNDDRLEFDNLLQTKEYAKLTFADYIYKRYGQTEAGHRRAIEASLVLRQAIRQKVVPSDKAEFERTLKFEFAMARQQYSQSPWFEISHIMIVPNGGMLRASEIDKNFAIKTAENISRQLQANPESFARLVDEFSNDTPENKANHGRLGGCYSDLVPYDVPESLFFFAQIKALNLEVGQFTPVLTSARGYHIVRLDRKHPAQQADYEFKRAQVERDYINEQSKFYADVWVRALNSRAIVKHFLYKQKTLQREWAEKYGIEDEDPLPPDTFVRPEK
jgi:parvulin-like peptidyl-prolyl isomerase